MPDLEHVSIRLAHNLGIPMSDGTVTRADVWRADDHDRRPTILVRTPYGKETHFHMSPVDPRAAVERGYAMVIQDVRGRGGSDGVFSPFAQERQDGFDTIEWIAAQPWSDGRVVMTGPSYVGATQWLAAAARPPALVAIAPLNSADDYGEGFAFTNGVREHGFLSAWASTSLAPPELQRPDDIEAGDADPEGLGALVPEVREWFRSSVDDPYWAEVSAARDRGAIDIPVLTVTGWYDIFLRGALRAHALRGDDRDRLVIGAWGHDNYFGSIVGPRSLGFAGSGDGVGLRDIVLEFFDTALAGRPSSRPPVSAYDPGSRAWNALPAWPPPSSRERGLPLESGAITVDPAHLPHGTGGRWLRVGEPGGNWGPTDQRPIAEREDVLVTALAPLEARTTFAGPVVANLRIRTDPPGTQLWVVLLCVRQPDGALDLLAEGVARTGPDDDAVRVPLGDLLLTLERGRELVVIVSGGLVPRWDPRTDGGLQQILDGSTVTLTELP
ncbi:MAG: CocE/NonD family hydrolase [Microbacteriaceae bacterium]|nr:CocE/NonD family hydrolase [Microbacteriaceae bacterium]